MLTLTQFVGLFNILVGLMLTTSLLLFATGVVMWIARLGTAFTHRDQAIHILEWAVGVLFSLIIIIVISKAVQQHTAAFDFLIGLAVVCLIGWAVIKAVQSAGESKEDH